MESEGSVVGSRRRVALASCRDLPQWEVDDRPLLAALRRRGVDLHRPSWDDPSFAWREMDACLIRTTWDYQERLDDFLAWARSTAATTRLFNPLPIVEWNARKTYLRDLEARGAAIVPTVWLPAGASPDLSARLAGRGWRRAFIKPVVGATSRETLPFRTDAAGLPAARRHLERLLPREPMMLQPFLPRVLDEGELSQLWIDGAFSHGVRKVPVPGDYRVQDDFGARDEPWRPTPAELEVGRRILAAAGADDLLYARLDFLLDDGGELLLSELELIEPSLFLRHREEAAERLAEALLRRLSAGA